MNRKRKRLPKFLYKYFPMEEKYAIRIFTHNELYFPNPNTFNDPFDCKAMLTLRGCDEEEYVRFVINNAIDGSKGRPLSDKKRLYYEEVARRAYNGDKRQLIRRLNNIIEHHLCKSINEFRILCLSKNYNDILMWSHYGRGHHGFVLQFDTKALLETFDPPPQKVFYPPKNSFPSLKDFNERHHTHMFLITKSSHWKYEKEWRILMHIEKGDKPTAEGKSYVFKKGLITGVILGCQMKPSEQRKIKGWIRKHQPQLESFIYRAIRDENCYTIKTEPEMVYK